MIPSARLAAGLVGLATVGALSAGFIASNASASGPDGPGVSHVSLGRQQVGEWLVRLDYGDGKNAYACSGSALSADWVLTARHCIDGARWMNATFPDGGSDGGGAVQADRLLAAPSGDLALVHLTRRHALNHYAQLAEKPAGKSASGVAAGYALKTAKQRPATQYSTAVTVVGTAQDAYGGDAVLARAADGGSDRGDSGGPLLLGGSIAGVSSTVDSSGAESASRGAVRYAVIGDSRDWIRSTAGV